MFKTEYATEEKAKVIVKQVVFGAHALHKAGIYHKDLKSSNWMLQAESLKLKIIDFGLAVDSNDRASSLLAQGYHPPEAYGPGDYQPSRVDIWQIGVALYSILFGRKPFGMDSFDNDIEHYKTNLRDLKYYFPTEISEELQDFFKKIFVYEEERITLAQMLQHPWLANVVTP